MKREPTICGGEFDAISKTARKLYQPTAGVVRYWKNKINKRARRKGKAELRNDK